MHTEGLHPSAVRVCYFVSEYPAVSHTFIRREIAALESNNVSVLRVSLRRKRSDLVDPADIDEQRRTRYLFAQSPLEFFRAGAAALARTPAAFFRTLACAVRLMRRSSRPRLYHLAYAAEALVVAKWVREEGVGHIHAHFGTNNAEVALLAHLLSGVPYSFTVHGPDEFDRPEYLGLAEKGKHASFVCAISSFTASQLYRWIAPADWPKIKVVRCGLDAAFTAEPPAAELPPAKFVTVGRLSEQKGHLVLLEAAAALSRQGVQFTLTIAGDGPLRAELAERIRKLGLERQVEITGWLTNAEVRARMLDARAVILPSFAEGLPIVLMEALALRRPVIATYVAGVPELVVHQLCGWLVPAGDANELARAMKQCLFASDHLIRRMGEAGRERVLKRHDIVAAGQALAALFRDSQMETEPGPARAIRLPAGSTGRILHGGATAVPTGAALPNLPAGRRS